MTAISLINPYAPQPVGGLSIEFSWHRAQTATPIKTTKDSGESGLASDQSGQGTGNGTGTGGAQLTTILERGRASMPFQHASSKSVVEAQSRSNPVTDYLSRQERHKAEMEAEYTLPNPLPTAPILQSADDQAVSETIAER